MSLGIQSSNFKNSNIKSEKFSKSYLRKKCLFENISDIKAQTKLNNELNKNARSILESLNKNSNKLNDITNLEKNVNNKLANENFIRNNNKSKINNELINFVRHRKSHMQHLSYWKQEWLFTDNPSYNYVNNTNFENPIYLYLQSKEYLSFLNKTQISYNTGRTIANKNHGLLTNFVDAFDRNSRTSTSLIMDIYESILEFNQNTNGPNSAALNSKEIASKCDFDINSPESNDSGIHSDDRLNRLNQNLDSDKKSKLDNNSIDSLYSSVDNSKKGSFQVTRESSNSSNLNNYQEYDIIENELNNENNFDNDFDYDEEIVHIEQHELTSGWIRCCDEAGIYYWHKPSGTVTRKPPKLKTTQEANTVVPKKNFSVKEFELNYKIFDENNSDNALTKSSVSYASSGCSSGSSSNKSQSPHFISPSEANNYEDEIEGDYETTNKEFSKSKSSSLSYTDKTSSLQSDDLVINKKSESKVLRFYVRSLGWVKIDEENLNPENSSKAVNRCINDLSRGTRDLNDVVARWGESQSKKLKFHHFSLQIFQCLAKLLFKTKGKDLYMDLQDNYLILTDPIDDKILNKQCITSIRVWGVGRDNGRDFAYVARDKKTKIHMCHVFRCDSSPAKEIANALRDTCRRIMNEKKSLTINTTNSSTSSILKRPNFLPEFNSPNSNRNKQASLINNKMSSSSESSSRTNFAKSMDEPRKLIRCRYLGNTEVPKASGIEVLNDGIEKIYNNAFNEYKYMKKQAKLKKQRANHFDDAHRKEMFDKEDDDDDFDDYDFDLNEDNAITFDSLLNVNTEKKIGIDVNVCISPSTISVRQVINSETSLDLDEMSKNDENELFECRTRYLSFMGISNDVRLCGFIMHCIDNTFKCHAFLCETSSGVLCKTIEAACKLRYQKCLDAHPETLSEFTIAEPNKQTQKFGYLGTQIKTIFDSFKNVNLFTNRFLSTKQDK